MQLPAVPITVAIRSDREMIVAGITTLLSGHPAQVQVVERPSPCPTAGGDPVVDVLVSDVSCLASIRGSDEAVHEPGSSTRVLLLGCEAHAGSRRPSQLGASAYLSDRANGRDLVLMIERVHAGEVVTHASTADLGSRRSGGASSRLRTADVRDELSVREVQMLTSITAGLSNQEMASMLFLSPNRVKTYIRTLYAKIGAYNRAGAVRWGIEHGFAPPLGAGRPR